MCLALLPGIRLKCSLPQGPLGKLADHVIICGSEDAFVNFAEQVRSLAAHALSFMLLHNRQAVRRHVPRKPFLDLCC